MTEMSEFQRKQLANEIRRIAASMLISAKEWQKGGE
jgi:hypothetical protein